MLSLSHIYVSISTRKACWGESRICYNGIDGKVWSVGHTFLCFMELFIDPYALRDAHGDLLLDNRTWDRLSRHLTNAINKFRLNSPHEFKSSMIKCEFRLRNCFGAWIRRHHRFGHRLTLPNSPMIHHSERILCIEWDTDSTCSEVPIFRDRKCQTTNLYLLLECCQLLLCLCHFYLSSFVDQHPEEIISFKAIRWLLMSCN